MIKRYFLFSFLVLAISSSWYFLSSGTDGVVGHYYSGGAAYSGIDRTGGPFSGGATCASCHGGGSGTTSIAFTLKNSSNVAVTSYLPGVSYTAEFQVTSSMIIKGFQGVALTSTNAQAGNFTAVLTSQSVISSLGGRQYPEHQGGTNSTGTFKFTWVAPASGTGNVTIYACGNGVNGLGSTSGDVPSAPITAVITEGLPTSISYPVTAICKGGANQSATVTGTTGGNFSSSPAGLSINITTGQVNPSTSTPGLYTITYTYPGGTATKTMRINPVYNINNTATICPGQSIFLAGANQTTAGVYTSNLQTVAGCDSIIVTTLSIVQPSSSNISMSTCAGDSVLVGGQYVSTAGASTIVIPNAAGCDSTITLNLTLNQNYTVLTSQTICQGESITFNGNIISAAGTYFDNGQTVSGCDSITSLQLTISPVNIGITNSSPTLTAQAANATYQWLDCGNNYSVISGATSQSYTPTANGTYAVKVTQLNCSDTSGCETVANVGLEEKSFGNVKLFPNPSDGMLGLMFSQPVNAEVVLVDLNGKILFTDKIVGTKVYSKSLDLESGMYFVEIKDNGIQTRIIWMVK